VAGSAAAAALAALVCAKGHLEAALQVIYIYVCIYMYMRGRLGGRGSAGGSGMRKGKF